MSRSTLTLDPRTNGTAQVTPDRFPANVTIVFSPQGQSEAYYGIDGQRPSIPLRAGQTQVTINVNSLQLSYSVISGLAKIQWEL